MWVKICANTTVEDAHRAADLGADAVGFVFAPSKRQVNAAQVSRMARDLPPRVERVGVFTSHDAEEIAGIVAEAGLTAVQLHGEWHLQQAGTLRHRLAPAIALIQTLHWTVASPGAAERLAAELQQVAASGITDRVLIDSQVGKESGGTGVAFDWQAARQVLTAAPAGLRLIVAGGLNPGNVAQAIAALAPWGVDVASGVEASPGKKDPVRLAQFLAKTHGAQTL